MSVALITGSCGLVGSESDLFFSKKGFEIIGIDNNSRRFFFGKDGDTCWIKSRLKKSINKYYHYNIDIRSLDLLEKGNFSKATSEFDNVFLNYPFSSLSSKSEIMSAYSLYQNNEIKKAETKLSSFIELNPKGELTEYAHYLLAMCYYSQVSKEDRDPGASIKSLNYFKLIITKYPKSKYAKDAKLKIHFFKKYACQK